MSRMYDRIIADGLKPPVAFIKNPGMLSAWREESEAQRKALNTCEVIVGDNVAEYFYAGTDQERWDIGSDFPCVAPPFESFWVEWKAPSRIVSRETGVTTVDPRVMGCGILFKAESYESAYRRMADQSPTERAEYLADCAREFESVINRLSAERQNELRQTFRTLQADRIAPEEARRRLNAAEFHLYGLLMQYLASEAGLYPPGSLAPRSDTAWSVSAYHFGEFRRIGVVGPILYWRLNVDSGGRVLGDPLQGVMGTAPEEWVSASNTTIFPALLTLSFLNCKNVKRVSNEAPAPLQRKHRKKTGKPLCRFWTLEIDAMRSVLRVEGGSETSGLKKALHICRGHFATYDEKPLFGKHTGRFWKEAHVRGSIKEGVVDKVYSMRSPRAEEIRSV